MNRCVPLRPFHIARFLFAPGAACIVLDEVQTKAILFARSWFEAIKVAGAVADHDDAFTNGWRSGDAARGGEVPQLPTALQIQHIEVLILAADVHPAIADGW